MAEYKYRALGWKDDDIASLNVVDGTADNQVELQITKQGAGGTIDGPAIFGKDGITINKAADSEKIEISGSGCVQHYGKKDYTRAYVVDYTGWDTTMIIRQSGDNSGNTLMQRNPDGSGEIVMPETPVDLSITNKKYVDDNYVKKEKNATGYQRVYAVNADGNEDILLRVDYSNDANGQSLIRRDSYGAIYVPDSSIGRSDYNFTAGQEAVNKKYVDDADKDLRLKLSNLEQALNGYILDTTKEAYADLDSAVLKDSVAVGNNVYPIADKTRALVTRIEGKTTKMVQLANTEALDNKQINNGITLIKNADGSLTANGTATAKTWGLFAINRSYFKPVAGSKYLLLGSPDGYGRNSYNLIDGEGRIEEGIIKTSDGSAISIRVVFVAGFVAENITFRPQLFNLTAIYGEGNEPTTVEQFKADFPNAFYPYAEGDLYSAKISGVKFYENQDKSGEQGSVTLPETYDLHGIGDYKDYLEITKNENNELYTLKKVQAIDKHVFDGTEAWDVSGYALTNCESFFTMAVNCLFVYDGKGGLSNNLPSGTWFDDIEHIQFGQNSPVIYVFLNKEKFKTGSDVQEYLAAQYASGNPLIAYYILPTPVETVIATNLTYEQVTAIRHNGGLIEVEGNTNKGYARPTVTNTIVYRLTAANTTEG